MAGAGRDVAAVWRRTQGNPFFVGELGRLLVDSPQGGYEELPVGVQDAVRGRLARLSEDCRTVVSVAAVLGSEVDAAGIAAATGCELAQVLTAMYEEDPRDRFDVAVERDRHLQTERQTDPNKHGEACGLHSLGTSYRQLGRMDQAMTCCQQALDIRREQVILDEIAESTVSFTCRARGPVIPSDASGAQTALSASGTCGPAGSTRIPSSATSTRSWPYHSAGRKANRCPTWLVCGVFLWQVMAAAGGEEGAEVVGVTGSCDR